MGTVDLRAARIGGTLECTGGKFEATDGAALSCDGAEVTGDVFLSAQDKGPRFEAKGAVRLLGAKIGGTLSCIGGKFEATEGAALLCDRAEVTGDVLLSAQDKGPRFEAKGAVRLLGAKIGGTLSCTGGKFEATEGAALLCDRAEVTGSVFLRAQDKGPRFEAKGAVRLLGAKIGGNLECIGGLFEAIRTTESSIQADGLHVGGSFFFRELAAPCHGVVLSSAVVGQLVDDLDAWADRLVLDGFEYGRIAGSSFTSAKDRLVWLDRQIPAHRGRRGDSPGIGSDFRPQPWQQLQRVLRAMGHFNDAREVAIAFEDRLREADRIGQPPPSLPPLFARPYRSVARLFHWAFKWLTGYGQRPMRLLAWMLIVWASCAVWYWFAAAHLSVFGPTSPLVFQNPAYVVEVPVSDPPAAEAGESAGVEAATRPLVAGGNWYLFPGLPEEYTAFSPVAYSLDVILPLVDLQQERDWAPLIPTPKAGFVAELLHFDTSWKHVTRLVLWFETLFGWVGSLLLVAIVSGLARRRED